MTGSPAADIGQMLEDAGVGTLGTDIFVGRDPDVPILTYAIYDTGGIAPNPKFLRDEPSVQVRVRGTVNAYEAAYTAAQLVKDILLGAATQVINSIDYVLFTEIGEILSLGYDESDRPILVSNWRLVREMQSGGNRIAL